MGRLKAALIREYEDNPVSLFYVLVMITNIAVCPCIVLNFKSRSGLVVSALDPGASGLDSSLSWGHYVVFLGKTLYSHSASLHPGV